MWEEELRHLLKESFQDGPIFGIGERAYPRLGPGLMLDDYGIICAMRTADIEEIRPWANVLCFQELFPHMDHPRDTLGILGNAALQERGILPPPGSRLVLYRQTQAIRQIVTKMGWLPMANPPEVWEAWENKASFRERAKQMGLPTVEFILVDASDFTPSLCSKLMKRWGSWLIVQVPDFPRGGGRASFLLREPSDSVRIPSSFFPKEPQKSRTLMISPWIEGLSLSMEVCVSPWGLMLSPLQLQLVDLEELLPEGGIGRFCGHQWGLGIPGSQGLEGKARAISASLGEAMAQEGYRGIFGLDFIWDKSSGELLLLECNPRYTGAFPTLTLLELASGVPPIEAFHLLSFAPHPPRVLPRSLARSRDRSLPPSSQLILFHRGPKAKRVAKGLLSGRYSLPQKGVPRRVGGILPLTKCPLDREEFLIVDGPPPPGYPLGEADGLERVVRMVFFREVVDESRGGLAQEISEIVRWAYREMGLEQDQ
jgi:hypothetical protein